MKHLVTAAFALVLDLMLDFVLNRVNAVAHVALPGFLNAGVTMRLSGAAPQGGPPLVIEISRARNS